MFLSITLTASALAQTAIADAFVVDGTNIVVTEAGGDLLLDAAQIDIGSLREMDLELATAGMPVRVEGLVTPLDPKALPQTDMWIGLENGPVAQTREHILLARQVGVPNATGWLDLQVTGLRYHVEVGALREEVVTVDLEFITVAVTESDGTVLFEGHAAGTTDPGPLIGSGKPIFNDLQFQASADGLTMESFELKIPTTAGLIGVEPDEIDRE